MSDKCPFCNENFIPAAGLSAEEHLIKGILSAYREMQVSEPRPCPRCGRDGMIDGVESHHEKIYICKDCFEDESIRIKSESVLNTKHWWVIKQLLSADGGDLH